MRIVIKKFYKYIPIILFFAYLLWIHHGVILLDGDDKVYQDTFANTTLLAWFKDFYMSWGGRVPLQLLDILFLNLPLVCWKIWNSILFVLIPIYISRFITLFYSELPEEKMFVINLGVCGLLMAMPAEILNTSILWVTGSFNYLLPMSMLLLALYPFWAAVIKKETKLYDKILALIGIFMTCYAEQTAAVFICMALFCIGSSCWLTKKVPIKELLLFLFGFVNAIVQYAAPGNRVRYDAELLLWNQTFDMYNLFDKILLGLIHFLKSVFLPGFLYFVVFLFLLGIICSYQKRAVQLYHFTLCILTFFVKIIVEGMDDGVIWQIYNTKIMLGIGIILVWVLLIAWFVICTFSKNGIISILIALFFLAAIASGVVMGMSPTVFASGNRVFLPPYILIIIACMLCFSEIMNKNSK